MLRFSDGMEFDTSGPMHTEHRSDGWYVVGGGMMFAVDTREEGEAEIAKTQKRRTEIKETA
jgi:hypothetical protein